MVAKQKKGDTRKLSVRVPVALWTRIKHACAEEQTTVQAFLASAFEDYLVGKIAREGRR